MTALAEMELPFPPPLSACYTNVKRRGRVKTTRYKAWLQHALYVAGRQPELKGTVSVVINATLPDYRKRDLDNLFKPLFDFLTLKRVIEDDSLVMAIYARWCPVGDPPGVRIQVLPFEVKT